MGKFNFKHPKNNLQVIIIKVKYEFIFRLRELIFDILLFIVSVFYMIKAEYIVYLFCAVCHLKRTVPNTLFVQFNGTSVTILLNLSQILEGQKTKRFIISNKMKVKLCYLRECIRRLINKDKYAINLFRVIIFATFSSKNFYLLWLAVWAK